MGGLPGGDDPNNRGFAQLGRMNVGSTETVTIIVQVGQDAQPGVLVNRARVETRRNDTLWPPAPDAPASGMDGGPRTPTADPDLTNNEDTEETIAGATVTATTGPYTRPGTIDGTGRYALAVPAGFGTPVITVTAAGYQSASVQVASAECLDSLQQGFSLQPVATTVTVTGCVEDKISGLPIAGATVQASTCDSSGSATTNLNGGYTITLNFVPQCTTWVIASAVGYNPAAESMFIPNGDTAAISFQLKQTPQSRVLLYYGNGGVGPTDEAGPPTDYTTMQSFYESLGFIVDYTDQWPTAQDWTSTYKLIVLLAPGHDSGDNVGVDGFTAGQKAGLDEFLQNGGHLVVLSDHAGFTGQAVENDRLGTLPVDLAFNSNSWADGLGNQVTDDCLTQDVAVFDTDRWTGVTSPGGTASPGAVILQNAGADPVTNCPSCEMLMTDEPSHGSGRVTIVGDLNFADDARRLSFLSTRLPPS